MNDSESTNTMMNIFFTILVILISFLSCISDKKKTKTSRMNIVFIMADDLGLKDLPIYGNKFNESPNISKLASQGLSLIHI